MNKKIEYLGILALFIYSCSNPSSINNKINDLLCKKWKLVAYEEEGKRFETPEKFQTSKMNFSSDHTVESTGKDNPSFGDWQYDENLQTIKITDKATKEVVVIKVKSLSETDFVIQIGKTSDRILVLYMKPDSTK